MAPSRQRDPSIERTEEYDDFIKKLAVYHEKRGTHLDREPKIAGHHIDLLRLYKRVCEEGGYDAMSDTKAKPLAWRKMTGEFMPPGPHLQYQAFMVKTIYYKNLAAYEITNFHHKDPPPKEILEDLSAKGGGILNRTVENYARQTVSREEIGLGSRSRSSNRENGSSEADLERTPKEERMDGDDTGSGRYSRSLRQQPPQRVLFQPDVSSTRQRKQTPTRGTPPTQTNSTSHYDMPTSAPTSSGGYVNGLGGMTLSTYEPRQQLPSIVKPAITPANTPELFKAKRNKGQQPMVSTKGLQQKGMMLPGTGFYGPNIYIRALLALQSGIPEEQDYALHHLVKISHERGDKYRFDGFPGLAEALTGKLLEVSSLFYDVRWDISHDLLDDNDKAPAPTDNVSTARTTSTDYLNAIDGTPNLLQKIASHPLLLHISDESNTLETESFAFAMNLINEAALALRNMVLLEENALYVSRMPLVRDVLTIVLTLPTVPAVIEIQHYALEIAEQLTKNFSLSSQDSFYTALVRYLSKTSDRGAIITCLRALSRIAMTLETNNTLEDIPMPTLKRIAEFWLLVEDEELRNAALDFLYQFTASADNVEKLVHNVNMEALIGQLVRFLTYGAVVVDDKRDKERERERARASTSASTGQGKQTGTTQQPNKPPKLSSDIVEQLNQLEEPERSSQWLRTCFEEDPAGEITQIAFWQAYQGTFLDHVASRPLLTAKDFITNVSATFPGATAQVINTPAPKYTITGIRPRAVPVDMRGKNYLRCLWRMPGSNAECDAFAAKASLMWDHVVSEHLNVPRDPTTGKFDLQHAERRAYSCEWGSCKRFRDGTDDAVGGSNTSPYTVAMHLRTHLPDESNQSSGSSGSGGAGGSGLGKRRRTLTEKELSSSLSTSTTSSSGKEHKVFLNTQTDERNDAAGLPLASILVLRNLVRQLPKIEPPSQERYRGRERQGVDGAAMEHVDDVGDEEDREEEDASWVKLFFAPVKEQLYYVMAYNLTLREYIASLTRTIAAAGV